MYVAIAGNIGSGKSSLTQILSARYALTPVFEVLDENPYLQDFYAHIEARPNPFAFHSQVFFLARRLEQHLREVNRSERVIQDRTVFEDAAIFARNLAHAGQMEARDWGTYRMLYDGIGPALRVPNLTVFIRCSLNTLRKRIRRRGRDFEQSIPDDYLERLNALYEEFIESYTLSPLIIVPGDEFDFIADHYALGWICGQLEAHGLDMPILENHARVS
jgi:deoxyadenosine/deoxycytidine kinase